MNDLTREATWLDCTLPGVRRTTGPHSIPLLIYVVRSTWHDYFLVEPLEPSGFSTPKALSIWSVTDVKFL